MHRTHEVLNVQNGQKIVVDAIREDEEHKNLKFKISASISIECTMVADSSSP